MILLDTNVVSEVMRPSPDPGVIGWLNAVDAGDLYLSRISIAEIIFGLELLPPGQRRQGLEERFEAFLSAAFAHRVLSFDQAAARQYGPIMAERRRTGSPMAAPDGQIAAIARSQAMDLATRNTSDFRSCGLTLINPWG
ncbi:MAG: type II toxin-antitoxin system VapC family toxin [Prochlorococcaceae cyanobacterium]